ncbi:hypothetical protein [Methylobacterium sp. Gmos1]
MTRLRRRMVCRLLVSGVLLGGTSGVAVLAQAPSPADRAAIVEQRLATAKNELSKIQESLRNAKAIVTYFELITRNLAEYRESFKVYEINCFERKRELEELQKENSPFVPRLVPAVQRCQADRAGFDETIRRFSAMADIIARDVALIKREVERLEREGARVLNDQKIAQIEQNLERELRELLDQTSRYKRSGF